MIAATALAHGLTIATRNARDFAKAGVPVVNARAARTGHDLGTFMKTIYANEEYALHKGY